MTKRIWVIMLSCFCWQLLHGADTKDNEVTGLITDERLRPIEFADVALFRAADSVFVTGSVSDAKGRFSFSPVDTGQYYVTYSFIGYETDCSETFTVANPECRHRQVGKPQPERQLVLRPNRRQSPSLLAQGRREGMFTTDIGVNYEIPRLHLSFTATLSDVFDTFRNVYTINTPQLQQRLEQKMNTRVFYIGITWKFNTLKQH